MKWSVPLLSRISTLSICENKIVRRLNHKFKYDVIHGHDHLMRFTIKVLLIYVNTHFVLFLTVPFEKNFLLKVNI